MTENTQPTSQTPQPIQGQPFICAECGLQVDRGQLADTCELCGAPRCRTCANADGGVRLTPYICSSCAADD